MTATRTRWQQALDLLRAARDVATRKGKAAKAAREQAAIDAVKAVPGASKPPAPKVPLDPYALTTHDGKVVDYLTDAALRAAEKRLGYSLTIVQGSYNAGGVAQSAGTHDGGGAVDLAPADWAHKVHAMRAVGFAAWHRPELPGVWHEHVHCILVSDAKASPSAKAQVVDYRNHLDGLAGELPDNTWHPDPIPMFTLPPDYRP